MKNLELTHLANFFVKISKILVTIRKVWLLVFTNFALKFTQLRKSCLYSSRGYSLVEMIIYISVLSIFFVVIVNSLLSFNKPYKEILLLRLLERSGLDSMERVNRDIRNATSVDLINSTLTTSPGVLVLNEVSGPNSTTTKFYLDNGVLKVDVNGVYQGPISSGDVSVSNLIFYRFVGTNSSGVKFQMTMSASLGDLVKTKNYGSSAVFGGI